MDGKLSEKFEQGAGSLYRIEPNDNDKIASGFRVSNGIAWNRAETRMYFVDTCIWCCKFIRLRSCFW